MFLQMNLNNEICWFPFPDIYLCCFILPTLWLATLGCPIVLTEADILMYYSELLAVPWIEFGGLIGSPLFSLKA